MTEQELRALVRTAVAQHMGSGVVTPERPAPLTVFRQHASHALFMVPSGADAEGPCIIEPAVQCNHCGYCKSMGH